MPTLGISIGLTTLYERVQVTTLPPLKLVWEDEGGSVPDIEADPI
jgi:hypothetical protein